MVPSPNAEAFFWSLMGSLATFIGRWLQSRYAWARIRTRAKQELRDPEKTDDPDEAMVVALAETEKPRLRTETLKLRQQMNGTGPYPKVKGGER